MMADSFSQLIGAIRRSIPEPVIERVWLAKKMIDEGEEPESDMDCIIRRGHDPDDPNREYCFLQRVIVTPPGRTQSVADPEQEEANMDPTEATPQPEPEEEPEQQPAPPASPPEDPLTAKLLIDIEQLRLERKGKKR